MSPLAIVLQGAIVGGALLGVLLLLGGTAVVDYRKAKARAAAYPFDGPCGCDGAGCIECDPDDEVCDHHDYGGPPELCTCDPVADDPGAEWDRARDRDLDYRAGVA